MGMSSSRTGNPLLPAEGRRPGVDVEVGMMTGQEGMKEVASPRSYEIPH